MEIEENFKEIVGRIEAAKKRSNRENEEVLLIGVSKTQPIDKLQEAFDCGIRVFGENKVQELRDKYPCIMEAKWHFIGHLQSNKVKYLIDKVEMIHSLDNLGLAEEINKRAIKINRKMPVLIQINIGREETKTGIFEEDVESFINNLRNYTNIIISGIMAIPPANNDKEATREYFKKVKIIYENIKKYKYENFDIRYLSMGMTEDFEIAIEEGSNIVRVGTGIFGKRNYNRG